MKCIYDQTLSIINIKVHKITADCFNVTMNSNIQVLWLDLLTINSHLCMHEEQIAGNDAGNSLATSMLVLMVRGLFTDLKFPYAQFSCTEVSGNYCKT